MGLFAAPAEDPAIWTVSELNQYIRELFDVDFRLQEIEVEGEISNYTRARSGHLYFTLKDDRSQLKCVMWRSSAERLRFDPQDGDAVRARGRVSVYEAGGVYQLYADRLQPLGQGDLALAFEQLKQKLAAEGLFDAERKKPLPPLPQKIGIVTSLDAAALRDILHVLRRRYPIGRVLIAPTLVQGREAPPRIVRALQWLDGREDVDLIIIARGGGSIEDLWAFNDEGVARAIAAAGHPIVSGVGHEIDFTIADFVADVRAPTPSAAAEIAVPDLSDLAGAIDAIRQSLKGRLEDIRETARQETAGLARALHLLSPRSRLNSGRQSLDLLAATLENALSRRLERAVGRVDGLAGRLAAVSPLATLARGYAIVRDDQGRIVRSVAELTAGRRVEIQVSDGARPAEIRADDG